MTHGRHVRNCLRKKRIDDNMVDHESLSDRTLKQLVARLISPQAAALEPVDFFHSIKILTVFSQSKRKVHSPTSANVSDYKVRIFI